MKGPKLCTNPDFGKGNTERPKGASTQLGLTQSYIQTKQTAKHQLYHTIGTLPSLISNEKTN